MTIALTRLCKGKKTLNNNAPTLDFLGNLTKITVTLDFGLASKIKVEELLSMDKKNGQRHIKLYDR